MVARCFNAVRLVMSSHLLLDCTYQWVGRAFWIYEKNHVLSLSSIRPAVDAGEGNALLRVRRPLLSLSAPRYASVWSEVDYRRYIHVRPLNRDAVDTSERTEKWALFFADFWRTKWRSDSDSDVIYQDRSTWYKHKILIHVKETLDKSRK